MLRERTDVFLRVTCGKESFFSGILLLENLRADSSLLQLGSYFVSLSHSCDNLILTKVITEMWKHGDVATADCSDQWFSNGGLIQGTPGKLSLARPQST